jgi:acyl carrier protein
MSNTVNELIDLIHNTFGLDKATLDADRPLTEYGLDSLALAEFLFAIDDHFSIEYPQSKSDVQTLRELSVVIDELRAAKAAA